MLNARFGVALVLFAVAFGTNVATPLLLIYEVELALSAWMITAIFAVYPIGLAPALAFAGPISDVYGRRPVALIGLVCSAVASVVMVFGEHQVGLLFVGRLLLGAASGLTFVTATAWMQELGGDAMRNARVLSTVLYSGFGLGPFVGGVLGQWGPAPLVTSYVVHIGIVAAALLAYASIPETLLTRPADRSVRPNLGIPRGRERVFWTVLVPTGLGVFAFPALTFGLFPVLLRPQMASVAVVATGSMFLIAMGLIVVAQRWVGDVGPYRAAPTGLALGGVGTALGVISFGTGWWGLLLPGAVVMGTGSGIAMTAGLRLVETLASARRRGALTGSFYLVAYAGMLSPLLVSTVASSTGYVPVLVAMALTAFGLCFALVRSIAHQRETLAERPVTR